jgi:hypothetical protein
MTVPRVRRPQILLAAVVLAVIVLPISTAGAAAPRTSAALAKRMAKQIKALKQQTALLTATLSGLQAKATALEDAPATVPVTGPAAGDLVGSYPNPQLRTGTIVGADIADGTIFGRHIATGTLSGDHIADGTIGSADITDEAIGFAHLPPATIGGGQLIAPVVVSRDDPINKLNPPLQRSFVSCPPGSQVVGGGFRWRGNDLLKPDEVSMIKSGPFVEGPNTGWEVVHSLDIEDDPLEEGLGFGGTISVRAFCLRVE